MNTPETNINKLKKFGNFVALGQPFMIEAISRYAKHCIDNKQELQITMKDSFINPDAWINAAEEWFKMYPEFKR